MIINRERGLSFCRLFLLDYNWDTTKLVWNTLWYSNMAGWKIPINRGFIRKTTFLSGPFSIAMFDYRRVLEIPRLIISFPSNTVHFWMSIMPGCGPDDEVRSKMISIDIWYISLCMYIYIYIYVCVCMYVCMYVYICVCVFVYSLILTDMCIEFIVLICFNYVRIYSFMCLLYVYRFLFFVGVFIL